MKLTEKGSFIPRPTLEGHAETVARAIESWPEVHARTHWELGDESIVDGADFYVGERELGHLHMDSEAHLAVSPTLKKALVEARLALPFRWSGGFVVHRVKSAADARHVEWLFRLAYDRLRGESVESLLARIEGRANAA